MRLVNLKEFLELPAGTLFCKYEPHLYQELMIKGESLPPRDFLYQDLVPLEEDFPYELDLQCGARDGCFEEKQMFAVLDKKDFQAILLRLLALDCYI